MKKVVVIYTGDDWSSAIPIGYVMTRKAFERWHTQGLEYGVEMYRASVDWYDVEKNVFNKSWAFRDEKWQRIEQPIMADLIYDKTPGAKEHLLYDLKMAMNGKSAMFNSPLFRSMVDNKLSQYAIFSEHMPCSFVATNKNELAEVVKKVVSSKIVVKPLQGSGGFGIVIDDKDAILKNEFVFPVLVQEFINNKNGIPGFSKEGELADLRITFMNHEPLYALSRIAKKGSLFTNMHQGAESVRVPLEAVPESVWKVTENIIKKLSMFPKAQYSLDFFFAEDGKPFFIEMNTVPGLCLIEALNDKELQKRELEAFIEMIPNN